MPGSSRRPQASRPGGSRPGGSRPRSGRPGSGRSGGGFDLGLLPPILSAVALAVVGVLSLNALVGSAGAAPGGPNPSPGASGGASAPPIVNNPRPSANPSVVVTPPPEDRTEVRGTLLFARTGNIWAASGTELRQVSNQGTDSFPVWHPDGDAIFFIETRTLETRVPYQGNDSRYTHYYPVLMRMEADGSERTVVKDGLIRLGGGQTWFIWLVQPAISPDGETFALVSDGPDGSVDRDVVLSLLPAAGGEVQPVPIREIRPYGHNDPAWSPDGSRIAFTYNQAEGQVGAPRIGIYDIGTKRLRLLKGSGYSDPSWSPDGRHLAAVRSDGTGRDLVILDASNGQEVIRLTRDGRSFAPTFAPDGTQLAYLHLEGQGVDLRLTTLATDGTFSVETDKAVTEDGSLDAASPPAWFFPPELRPAPASPAPSVVASGEEPSPSGSALP